MDPDIALRRLRETMGRLREWAEADEWHIDPKALSAHDDDLADAVEAFESLDGWLSIRGFAPQDWGFKAAQTEVGAWPPV